MVGSAGAQGSTQAQTLILLHAAQLGLAASSRRAGSGSIFVSRWGLTLFSFCSYFRSMERETLATYPLVSVRIACRNCKRRGSYRLARLAERYGADTTLEDLLIKVTADCNLASNRTGRPGCRAAYFPDLDRSQPDLPREAAARHCG